MNDDGLPTQEPHGPAGDHHRRDLLLELGGLLGVSREGLARLELACDAPVQFVERHRLRLAERGIHGPQADLPWIALVDLLVDEGACAEVDWKADNGELKAALSAIRQLDDPLRLLFRRHQLAETAELLGRIGTHLAGEGTHQLCSIDYGADAYALVLIPVERTAGIQQLAEKIGWGAIRVWQQAPDTKPRQGPAADATSARLHLRATLANDNEGELLALPGSIAVALGTDGTLHIYSPSGAHEVIDVRQDLLPEAPDAFVYGELALARCGRGFAVLSNRRVRVWPDPGGRSSTVLDIDGTLPSDRFGRRPGPVHCCVSDQADTLVAIFHAAGSIPASLHLAMLRLDVERRKAVWMNLRPDGSLPSLPRDLLPLPAHALANPELYPAPLLTSAAWLEGALYVCAAPPGEKDRVLVARVAPDGGVDLLLTVEDRAWARFVSSGQEVLVNFLGNRKPRQALWNVKTGAWHPLPKVRKAPAGCALLDHEGGLWWWRHKRAFLVASPDPAPA